MKSAHEVTMLHGRCYVLTVILRYQRKALAAR